MLQGAYNDQKKTFDSNNEKARSNIKSAINTALRI
jgi:hypothetical protein